MTPQTTTPEATRWQRFKTGARKAGVIGAVAAAAAAAGYYYSTRNPDTRGPLGAYLGSHASGHDGMVPVDLKDMQPAQAAAAIMAEMNKLNPAATGFFVRPSALAALPPELRPSQGFMAQISQLVTNNDPILYTPAARTAFVRGRDMLVLDSHGSWMRTETVTTLTHPADRQQTVNNRSTFPGVVMLNLNEAGRVFQVVNEGQSMTTMVSTNTRGALPEADVRNGVVDSLVNRGRTTFHPAPPAPRPSP